MSPTLWAFIVVDGSMPTRPQLYLRRSGSCDLDLTIRSLRPHHRDWLMKVIPLIAPRLRRFSIDQGVHVSLLAHLCYPAPFLRSLRLTHRLPPGFKPLFDIHTLRLSNLHLADDGYYWPSTMLRNLTHLHLGPYHRDALPDISYSDFLTTMELNPHLEELILNSTGLRVDPPDHRKVLTTNLRRLVMHECHGQMIEYLLSCLSFSPSIAIVVSCPSDGRILLRRFKGVIPDGFIDGFAFKKACICAIRYPQRLRITLANQTAALIFQITHPYYGFSDVLRDLAAIPSLSMVEELYLHFNLDLISNCLAIRPWLSALPNLTTLSTWIGTESMTACKRAELPLELTSTLVDRRTTNSPRLSDVTIHIPSEVGSPGYRLLWWTTFFGVIKEREKRGHPISRITAVNDQPYLVALQSRTSSATVTEIYRDSPIIMELPDVCAVEIVPGKNRSNWSNCWKWADL